MRGMRELLTYTCIALSIQLLACLPERDNLHDPGSSSYAPGTWKTIKAGSIQMGSPTSEKCRNTANETQHSVTLSKKFMMMTTEVTQGQYKAVTGASPSNFTSCGTMCPVENVTWHEAAAYSNALSSKAGLTGCYTCSGSGKSVSCTEATSYAGQKVYTCPGYRLPTEAEWEFAYRAATSTAFYNGGITSCTGKDANLDKIGWYCENSSGTTHPVGQMTANAWGLYDMAGNVWEWCHDWYGSYPSSAVTDPVGTSGSSRVFRGGGWSTYADRARAAFRYSFGPGGRSTSLGFRLVRSVP